MSWSTTVTASTDILEKDIDDIVENLPEKLSHKEALAKVGLHIKHPWGWSCGTDIYLPEGRRLEVRGAGFSYNLAEDMVKSVKTALRERGYKNVRNSRIN